MRWARHLTWPAHLLNVDGARRISNRTDEKVHPGLPGPRLSAMLYLLSRNKARNVGTIHAVPAETNKRALLWAALLVVAFVVGFGLGAALWEGG